jgi:segregation and condensation protein B
LNKETVKKIIESILFVAGDAVDISDIAAVLEVEINELSGIVDELITEDKNNSAGILITRIDEKLQLCSNPEYTQYIEKTLQPVKKTRLSQSILETLAIIAYRQPITRFEIEQIRGVKCNYSVAVLIENGLIIRAGRKKALGNPMMYVTSENFLRHFGISKLDELPPIKTADQ